MKKRLDVEGTREAWSEASGYKFDGAGGRHNIDDYMPVLLLRRMG